jgi:alpha-tubulin suppressor-like RCC1 family protein
LWALDVGKGGTETFCLLTDVGTQYCWGSNYFGTFGNGSTVDSADPTPVLGLPSGHRVKEVSVGGYKACAVLDDGSVWCWATTPRGRLATGQPPTAPGHLTATKSKGSPVTVTLKWQASTDDVGVAGYDIYRNHTRIDTSMTTSWIDTAPLPPGSSVVYYVRAVDGSGNVSPPSNSATVGM